MALTVGEIKRLERRLNPETGLVRPDWKGIARELGVSRSTIARRMVGLRQSGAVESVYIKVGVTADDIAETFFLLQGELRLTVSAS